ncbi:MAG: hypothetical protein IPN68_00215 [Bacteroidetes bacterium]|nr:hypothetical protein [Bacteroidota bacterium]
MILTSSSFASSVGAVYKVLFNRKGRKNVAKDAKLKYIISALCVPIAIGISVLSLRPAMRDEMTGDKILSVTGQKYEENR